LKYKKKNYRLIKSFSFHHKRPVKETGEKKNSTNFNENLFIIQKAVAKLGGKM
jgi:hypothetical protein